MKKITRPSDIVLIAIGLTFATIIFVSRDTLVTYLSLVGFFVLFVFVKLHDAYQDNKKQEREDRKEQEEKRRQEEL